MMPQAAAQAAAPRARWRPSADQLKQLFKGSSVVVVGGIILLFTGHFVNLDSLIYAGTAVALTGLSGVTAASVLRSAEDAVVPAAIRLRDLALEGPVEEPEPPSPSRGSSLERNLEEVASLYLPARIKQEIEGKLKTIPATNSEKAELNARYEALQEREDKFFDEDNFKKNYGIDADRKIFSEYTTTPIYIFTANRADLERGEYKEPQKEDKVIYEKNTIDSDLIQSINITNPETHESESFKLSPFTKKPILSFEDVRTPDGKKLIKEEIKTFMTDFLADLQALAADIEQVANPEQAGKKEQGSESMPAVPAALPVVHGSPINISRPSLNSTQSDYKSSASDTAMQPPPDSTVTSSSVASDATSTSTPLLSSASTASVTRRSSFGPA